jgi:hypothetical protein
MATLLRKLYDVLDCFSTATHTSMIKDLSRRLSTTGNNNLATFFAKALVENQSFNQIEQAFVPSDRSDMKGRNPVTAVLEKASPVCVPIPETDSYAFSFLQRELMHLRATSLAEQPGKAWIDYVANAGDRPILGEVKWQGDANPFYAFIQLLTYLSEMATPNQIERARLHRLFGNSLPDKPAFDLHILLANFNDRGKKGELIDPTRELASAFKKQLQADHPLAATCLGRILCLSAEIDEERLEIKEIKCNWAV